MPGLNEGGVGGGVGGLA